MTSEDRIRILEGAKEAFFLAILDGYAGNENRRSIKTKTHDGCTKTITFICGDYIVEDKWHTYPDSNKSFGSTLITYLGKPVWSMHYGGWYKEEVINFLKQVLFFQYTNKKFTGGRGPDELEKMIRPQDTNDTPHRLKYTNQWEGNFWSFKGDEYIYRKEVPDITGSTMLGHHHFFGGTII